MQRFLPTQHFLKGHYEKLGLGLAGLTLAGFGLFYGLADFGVETPSISTTPEPFLITLRTSDSNTSMAEIETRNPHGLMPGDQIKLSGVVPASFNKSFLVEEIVFPEGQEEITVFRRDGTELTGYFREAQGKLALGATRAKLKLTIDVDGSEITIKGEDVNSIIGPRFARFALDDNSSADEAHGTFRLVVFQRQYREQLVKKPEPWIPPAIGDGNVSYDLFTPPRIFMVDGKLSPEPPKPPEAVKAKELFGVRLISFESKPYRYNIKSWSATDPQLYDGQYKRNSLVQVGKCYKNGVRQTGYRIKLTTEDDPEKAIKIIDFKVKMVERKIDSPDGGAPRTAGIRPVAILKIFDYTLQREITMTNEAPSTAGQLAITLTSTLPETTGETKNLTEASTGFFLGDREYRVLKIDQSTQSLLLEKLTDNPEDNEKELLRLPDSTPSAQEP